VREKYCWLVADKPSEQGYLLIELAVLLCPAIPMDSESRSRQVHRARLPILVWKVIF
jgi:hypothetical protein